MATVNTHLRWYLEVHPWTSQTPTPSDKPNSLAKATTSFLKSATSTDQSDYGPITVYKGITGVVFGRNKSSPQNELTLSIVGPIDPSLIIGNWVVLRSVSKPTPPPPAPGPEQATLGDIGNKGSSRVSFPRFIGQIYEINVTYNRGPDGLLSRITYVRVREWSACLDMLVKYDEISLYGQQLVPGDHSVNIASAAEHITQQSGQFIAVASKVFNPYEYVQLVLKLVGAISSSDQVTTIKGLNFKLPPNAGQLPIVPKSLTDSLGIKIKDAKSPFSTGFVKVFTGVQNGPFLTEGDFSGVFTPDQYTTLSKLYNNSPRGRPVVYGLTLSLAQGNSVWSLMQKFGDTTFNEIFSDLIFIQDSKGNVAARPALFVRDKPFLLKFFSNPKSPFTIKSLQHKVSWTYYDSVPRIYLDSSYIMSASFANSFLNSPNDIRINFTAEDPSFFVSAFNADALSRRLLPNERARFGGIAMLADTNFFIKDALKLKSPDDAQLEKDNESIVNSAPEPSNSSPLSSKLAADEAAAQAAATNTSNLPPLSNTFTENPDWWSKLGDILQAWHAYSYRMPSCVLNIKDNNLPLTVGFNLTFNMGNVTLVGQIEGFSTQVQVDGDGNQITNTSISLSRIVKVVKSDTTLSLLTGSYSSSLDFLGPNEFTELLGQTIKKSSALDVSVGELDKFLP